MTDYLTGLTARNQNLARGIRPRLPMRFEPRIRRGSFYSKGLFDPIKTAVSQSQSLSDELFIEDTEVEPPIITVGKKQVPSSITGISQKTRSSINTISPQTVSLQQEQPERKLNEKPVSREFSKKKAEPEKPNQDSPKGEVPASNEFPNPSRRKVNTPSERVTIQAVPNLIAEDTRITELPTATKKKKNILKDANRHNNSKHVTDDSEKIKESEHSVMQQPRNSLIETIRHERVLSPKIIRKYPQRPETSSTPPPVKEPQIQVTIGRIEIRAIPVEQPRKKREVSSELNLEGYLQHPVKRGVS